MKTSRKLLLLSLGCAALLSACDDNAGHQIGWLEWLKHKSHPSKTPMIGMTDEDQETQSGNYLAGQFAQYHQDWKNADLYLDKVMAMDPANTDLKQKAMILAMQAGDTARAVGLARQLGAEDKDNILANMFIGTDDFAKGNYSAAIRDFNAMPQGGLGDFIRPILTAWASVPQKKFDNDGLIAAGPLHAYQALLIADYLGPVENPEKYFITVVTGGGADLHILEMMADVYARQGKTDLAKKIYDTLVTQYQQGNAASPRLKLIKAKREDFTKAQATKIGSPSAGAAEAFFDMARILYTEKSQDSALVFARLAQELDPAREEPNLLMAKMMADNNHVDEAIKFYRAIKADSANYLDAQRSIAELMEQHDRIDEAVSYLEKDYGASHDVNALIQIGDVYRRAEKYTDAVKAYERAADALGGKIGPDHWNLLYARGMSYERTGDMKRAEDDLLLALRYKPDHPYLLNYLGYSWADQGKKLDQALEYVQKAAALKPDDGYIVDSLGWVYYKLGKYPQAASELEKAVELVPYDPTINDHLGDAYWQVGRKNEARFEWQRALNHTKDDKDKPPLEAKIDGGLNPRKPVMIEVKPVKPPEPVKR